MTKPYLFINMAMSLDGKISTIDDAGPKFSSKRDKQRLEEIRSTADAILCGAKTILADDPTFNTPSHLKQKRLDAGLAENPIKAVLSGSGSVPENARMFQPNGAKAVVFTTELMPLAKRQRLQQVADVHILGQREVDFPRLMEIFAEQYQVKRLLVEGGGSVNFPFFKHRFVDEIFLTLCPKVIGGKEVPTIVDGEGFCFDQIHTAELISSETVGDEIFLRYRMRET